MPNRRLIAWAIVVALALAVGAGTTVLAQGATATPTAPSSLFWASLAQRLNTTPVALEQSVRDAAKDVVSQRVSAGQLTQQQADALDARIDKWQGGHPFAALLGRGGQARERALHAQMTRIALDAAAQALGLTPADLLAQLRQGQTLRQLAQARNVDPTSVQTAVVNAEKAQIDKAVAAGKLTTIQGDKARTRIDERAATLLDHAFKPAPSGAAPQGKAAGKANGPYAAAATALGIPLSELMTDLRAGQSLRDVAQAKSVDPVTVQAAVLNALKGEIDQAVAAGRLTVQRADAARARVATTAAQLMDRKGLLPKAPAGPKKPTP